MLRRMAHLINRSGRAMKFASLNYAAQIKRRAQPMLGSALIKQTNSHSRFGLVY
jgi:hypothetical protein